MKRFIPLLLILLGAFCLSAQEAPTKNLNDELRRVLMLSKLQSVDSALHVVHELEYDFRDDTSRLLIIKNIKLIVLEEHYQYDSVISTCNAMFALEKNYPLSSPQRLDVQFSLAKAYLETGQFNKAIEQLEELLVSSQSMRTDLLLAEAYIGSGRYQEALDILDQRKQRDEQNNSVTYETDESSAYQMVYLRSKALFALGRYEEAREQLEPLGTNSRSNLYTDPGAQILMGKIYSSLAMYNEACNSFKNARTHTEKNISAELASNKYYLETLLQQRIHLELMIKESCSK